MRKRQAALSAFRQRYIAHRGLFDNNKDYPENTLAAFSRAVQAGFGIELDVHLTKDGQVVVAHDDDLRRICGEDININEMTYDELRQRRVLGSSQTIPLFSEVLDVIDGQVPLVVEIKFERKPAAICVATDQVLRDYQGPYCIESFDPRVVLWYRWHRPSVLRGQLSDSFVDDESTGHPLLDRALTSMVFNLLTWPDFIAYNWQYAANFALHFWHRIMGCTLVAWTIRSQTQLDKAKHTFNVFIFDSFIPE